MLRILNLRLKHGPHDPASVEVTNNTFFSIAMQSIGLIRVPSTATAPPMADIPLFLPPATRELCGHFLGHVEQALKLCRTLPWILARGEKSASTLYTTQLMHLHYELVRWETSVPDTWRCTVYSEVPAIDRKQGLPAFVKEIRTFPSINAIVLWTTFWYTRLDVLQCLYQLDITPPQRLMVENDMELLVDTICSAMPRLIGQPTEVNGAFWQNPIQFLASIFASGALFSATQVPDLPVEKRTWILQQLEVIGQQRGIGQLLVAHQALMEAGGD